MTFKFKPAINVLTFFDLWPLNGRSHDEVTMDTFVCLSLLNMSTLVFFDIWDTSKFWPFLTFDPLLVGRVTGSLWIHFLLWPCPTHWHCYFWNLRYFKILTFFDLWPLNDRSDDRVTVDTFSSLTLPDTLAPLIFQFDIFDFFCLFKNEFDLLTPLTTFDPDEKKYTCTRQKCIVPI